MIPVDIRRAVKRFAARSIMNTKAVSIDFAIPDLTLTDAIAGQAVDSVSVDGPCDFKALYRPHIVLERNSVGVRISRTYYRHGLSISYSNQTNISFGPGSEAD